MTLMKLCAIGTLDRDNNEMIDIYENEDHYYRDGSQPIATVFIVTVPQNRGLSTAILDSIRRKLNKDGVEVYGLKTNRGNHL